MGAQEPVLMNTPGRWRLWSNHVCAHPDLYFLLFCLLHLICWTFLPALVQPNAHLDVLECLAWGKEWQWGYHKHPPLHAWVTEVFFMPFGNSLWPGFLLSQLCVVLTFTAVWRYVAPRLGKLKALVSILLLEGIYYYNFTSPEFNSNVSLLPLWAWTAYVFFRALKRESLLHWAMFGVMMGLCVLSKYASFVLGAVFVAYLFMTPHGRSWLKRPGPYLSMVIFVLVIFPHVKWVLAHEGQTLMYLAGRSGSEALAWWHRFVFPVDFVLAQAMALLPMAFLLSSFYKKLMWKDPAFVKFVSGGKIHSWEETLLQFLAFGPLVVTFMVSFCFNLRLRSMWGTPFFTFLPAYLLCLFFTGDIRGQMAFFLRRLLSIFVLGLVAYGGMTYGQPYVMKRAKRVHFPGQACAQIITQEWHKYTHQTLSYVIGDIWEAGNIGFYSPDRPAVVIDGQLALSPWVEPTQLREAGAVIVWTASSEEEGIPEPLRQRYPRALRQPVIRLTYQTGAPLAPVLIGWALIPPRSSGRDFLEI